MFDIFFLPGKTQLQAGHKERFFKRLAWRDRKDISLRKYRREKNTVHFGDTAVGSNE